MKKKKQNDEVKKQFLPALVVCIFNVLLYTYNIVIISIKGANLSSNICAWALCIFFALVVCLLDYYLIKISCWNRRNINHLKEENINLMLENIELKIEVEEKENEKQ